MYKIIMTTCVATLVAAGSAANEESQRRALSTDGRLPLSLPRCQMGRPRRFRETALRVKLPLWFR